MIVVRVGKIDVGIGIPCVLPKELFHRSVCVSTYDND